MDGIYFLELKRGKFFLVFLSILTWRRKIFGIGLSFWNSKRDVYAAGRRLCVRSSFCFN